MSSLSRTYARESKRNGDLMKQHQPKDAYQAGETLHKENLAKKHIAK